MPMLGISNTGRHTKTPIINDATLQSYLLQAGFTILSVVLRKQTVLDVVKLGGCQRFKPISFDTSTPVWP